LPPNAEAEFSPAADCRRPLSLHLDITAGCSAAEKAALFAGTAAKFYQLGRPHIGPS
jgi:predicted TIM-barrel fold metal-dependent hydrolase